MHSSADVTQKICLQKEGQKPRLKSKPQRYMCGLVSATVELQAFVSLMESWMPPLFVQIIEGTLLPFVRNVYPASHSLMQDNDPKHNSKMGKKFLEDNNVNWWRTPPESPDLNPIENLWHEL